MNKDLQQIGATLKSMDIIGSNPDLPRQLPPSASGFNAVSSEDVAKQNIAAANASIFERTDWTWNLDYVNDSYTLSFVFQNQDVSEKDKEVLENIFNNTEYGKNMRGWEHMDRENYSEVSLNFDLPRDNESVKDMIDMIEDKTNDGKDAAALDKYLTDFINNIRRDATDPTSNLVDAIYKNDYSPEIYPNTGQQNPQTERIR